MAIADPSGDNKVGVIIAAYNTANTIGRAISSALLEPEVSEVIVVDDASPDNTYDAAKAADDGSGRLKVFRQATNGGPSAARNFAIGKSVAPWISILDADDLFLRGRMARLLEHANSADLLADDAGRTPEGYIQGPYKSLLKRYVDRPRYVRLAEFVLSNVSRAKQDRAELGFLKPIIRRSFLDLHSLRYKENMRLGEDYELYTRAIAVGGRFLVIPSMGYISIVRPDSLSGKHGEIDLLNLRDCDDDLATMPNLDKTEKMALRRHYLSVDCRLQWRLLISAVKMRNIRAALATFIRPFPVPLFLTMRLWEQIVVRTLKKAGHND